MEKLPVKDEIWQHTKTGKTYVIVGTSLNAITDKIEVVYEPLYAGGYHRYTRQLVGHPKAWMSKNSEGKPRFQKVANGQHHRFSA